MCTKYKLYQKEKGPKICVVLSYICKLKEAKKTLKIYKQVHLYERQNFTRN
jgi:hypothetical protein